MKQILSTAHQQRGMALLEIIVAMLIFALAILPLVRLQVMSMDATKAGYLKTETAAAAQSVMDYISSDESTVYNPAWTDIIVTSGQNCSSATPELAKTACHILNGQFSTNTATNTHPPGNAVLCIYQQPATSRTRNDQRLISIRAIWYIGKRQDGAEFLNSDLGQDACGRNYTDTMPEDIINKQNIDSIKINMAY